MSARVHTSCDECGWSGTYTSTPKADYAYSRHSCERWTEVRASTRRAAAREAAIDRTPKHCPHPNADHQHGTYRTYTLDRCRCIPCATAASAYNADLARRNAYGRSNLVDADPVRAHVAALREAGMGLKRIALASGVSTGGLSKLVYGTAERGPSKRVRRPVAEAILAVAAVDLADAALVDPTGTRRRLEALIALGWSVRRLAADHGLGRQALDRALAWAPVQVRTARAVAAMFDKIGDTPPPEATRHERQAAARSRNLAKSRGWAVPAEWDTADLDDPYADPPATDDGRREPVDLDEWCFLVGGGVQPESAARRLGVTLGAIESAAKRNSHERTFRLLSEWRAVA